ncbi:MAG TPA: S41 family peptidase [Pyrinomonadaceae bacterium]|nr:S41 family peptidase [Pyrinomonadaceae bacterium]
MRIDSGKVFLFRFLICLPLFLTTFVFVKAQQIEAPLIKSETNLVQNLNVFDALWEKVTTKYFDPKFNGVDWLKIRENYRPLVAKAVNKTELLAILKKMLSELKTSHLNIWQTVSKKKIEKKILTDFDPRSQILQLTYGFSLKNIDGKPVVIDIFPKTSAEAKKVKIGWKLLSFDGKPASASDLDFGEIFEGRKIDLQFQDTQDKELKVTLTADWSVKKFSLASRLLVENIGYIRFDGFTADMGKWLQIELQKFDSVKGVIIDLRGNRGGFVEEVKKCLGQFFVQNIEFGTFIERSGKTKDTEIKGKKDKAFKGKLVVLVDDESFSGAEIFAQIIKETGRGQIVGTHTKGLVLNSVEFGLPDDFRVSIAFRDYISPQGYRIEGKGVAPNFEVPLTIEEILKNRDLALEKALEIIK